MNKIKIIIVQQIIEQQSPSTNSTQLGSLFNFITLHGFSVDQDVWHKPPSISDLLQNSNKNLLKQMIWKQPLLQEYVGVKGVRGVSSPEITLLLLIVLKHEAVSVWAYLA